MIEFYSINGLSYLSRYNRNPNPLCTDIVITVYAHSEVGKDLRVNGRKALDTCCGTNS